MKKSKLKEKIKKLESELESIKSATWVLENELQAEIKIHKINKQALVSCENANNELQVINRYLSIELHEKIRNELKHEKQ